MKKVSDEGGLAGDAARPAMPGLHVARIPVEREGPGGPARLPAGPLVWGRQGCGLAAMAAVGIRLGGAVEGSLRWAGSHPPRTLPGAARIFSADGKAG